MICLRNIFIYLRKSRKDIEEEKKAAEIGDMYDTLERHRRQLLDLAKRNNFTILDILNEDVVSGEYISERPVMQRLLREVESRRVNAVLVMDLDRLGRGDMSDQGAIDRTFRLSGTKIITPSEVYDPESESWELVFGIKSLFAREELKTTNKRLMRGRRQSATEGRHIANRPPFGYKRDKHLKLYPDPDTAWIVKKIFELTLNGWGRKRIAIELQKLGIKSPMGKDSWGTATIRQILTNEVYIGKIVWGKQKNVKIDGKYVPKKLPQEKWVVNENSHEAIISEDLFENVQDVIKHRYNPSVPQDNELKNTLAGLLKCSICGMTMKYTKPPKRPNAYIHCQNVACQGKQRSATFPLVEERILEGLEQIVDDFKLNEDMFEKKKESNSLIFLKEKAINNKKQELKNLTTQKDNLHDLLEQGIYTVETFLDRQKSVGERIRKLENELSLLEEDLQKEIEQIKNYTEYVPAIKAAIEAYRKTENATKKNRLLKSILEKATFYRDETHKRQDEFVIQLYLKY
ncbi:recombinase family protein [Bacillus niameyensis]|uniref:recombinase family protein n=1 Tax=Bacillus niameyensis TaxID=1522308 RepID=UPI003898DA82